MTSQTDRSSGSRALRGLGRKGNVMVCEDDSLLPTRCYG